MLYIICGFRKSKYGYEIYCQQFSETDDQTHEGLKVLTAYAKESYEPKLGKKVTPKWYKDTEKYYIF